MNRRGPIDPGPGHCLPDSTEEAVALPRHEFSRCTVRGERPHGLAKPSARYVVLREIPAPSLAAHSWPSRSLAAGTPSSSTRNDISGIEISDLASIKVGT